METAPAIRSVSPVAIRAVADTPRDTGTGPGRTEATERAVSLLHARMANKVLNAQTAMERLWNYGKPAAIRRATMTSAR